jgi:Fur family ferric uptake transcriptional regulator
VAQTFDRVTVYRTLKTFLDKGMIHKVLDDGGALKYALCHYCQGENHQHDHVHFKCAVCGETSCLDDVYVPRVNLPEGYQVAEVNLLVQGVCARCR